LGVNLVALKARFPNSYIGFCKLRLIPFLVKIGNSMRLPSFAYLSFAYSCLAHSLIFLGVYSAPLQAQDLGDIAQQNMAFDQQFNNQLQGLMQQNQMQQQQMVQGYIQSNGPQLRQEYQQFLQSTGMQISFEQFVYSHIATQGGRNPGPALQQQQNNFRVQQENNRTVQQGYNDYNQAWTNNQQVLGNAMQRYDQQAIQGNAYYNNPQTGETVELPYGGNGQAYQGQNGNNYYADPNGQYRQYDSQGYGQDLNLADPYDDE